jgi:hypothetical protein
MFIVRELIRRVIFPLAPPEIVAEPGSLKASVLVWFYGKPQHWTN